MPTRGHYIRTEEHKRLMRERTKGINIGRHLSPNTEFKKGLVPWSKGHHLSDDTRKCLSEALEGREITEEHKEHISDSLRGKRFTPEHKAALSASSPWKGSAGTFAGHKHTAESKVKMSAAKKGKPSSLRGRKRPQSLCNQMSIIKTELYKNAAARQKMSEAIKPLWENPEYVAKVLVNRRPTVSEKRVKNVLDKYLPNRFGYNGDFSLGVSLSGLIPDFVNVNGSKEVIEVFGDYWHRQIKNLKWRRTELGRMMAYNSLGYSCLILWDSEVKKMSEADLASRILSFSKSLDEVAK